MKLFRIEYVDEDGELTRMKNYDLYVWTAVNKRSGEVDLTDVRLNEKNLIPLLSAWEWKKFKLVLA